MMDMTFYENYTIVIIQEKSMGGGDLERWEKNHRAIEPYHENNF